MNGMDEVVVLSSAFIASIPFILSAFQSSVTPMSFTSLPYLA